MSSSPVGESTLPDVSSFMDIVGSQSRQSSSSGLAGSESKLLEGPIRWKLGEGLMSSPSLDSLIGFDLYACAHSDTHPDVVATLVAEYITDTILRIDSGAFVDIAVHVKQDLMMITGEVGCSHPAKTGIVHSDQFQSTLNASIRELLREVGFEAPNVPPTTSTLGGTNSPTRKGTGSAHPPATPGQAPVSTGSSPPSPSDEKNDFGIDPTQVHIVLALTDPGTSRSSETTHLVSALASNREYGMLARQICSRLSAHVKDTKTVIAGGISVEIIPRKDGSVGRVCVSIGTHGFTEELVRDVRDKIASFENLKGLSPGVSESTVVELRTSQRHRGTGTSFGFAGKAWIDPRRFGHVVARQEALNLIRSGACTACQVTIRLGNETEMEGQIPVASIHVDSFGTSKESDKSLTEKVIARIKKRTVTEIQESVFTEPNASFYVLECGGSVCNHDVIR